MNKQAVKDFVEQSPMYIFFGGTLVLLIVWLFVIQPGLTQTKDDMAKLPDMKKELIAIRELGDQIKILERTITADDKGAKKPQNETILKRMERVAQETKVFAKVSRVSPSTIRRDGRDLEALVVEFDALSLAALTPFLHSISHKSLLEVSSMDMRRNADEDGMMSVRLNIVQP